MTLKERFLAKDSWLGKLLSTWVSYFLLFCAGLESCLEYLSALPSEWHVPDGLKLAVLFAGIITKIAGHMTVDKKKTDQDGSSEDKL